MQRIIAYFNFLRRSTDQHGIHSPFVFKLVTTCLYDQKKYPKYKVLQKHRHTLRNNKRAISVKDLGAGSKLLKSSERNISSIAKNAGISKKRAKLLFRMVKYFQPKKILELGTSLGMATVAMHQGNTEATITTLEGCPDTADVAKKSFKAFDVKNVDLIVNEFSKTLPKLKDHSFDLIFFDGNHQKEATLEYFDQLLPTAHNRSVWVFDDIHWSEGMEQAWQEIQEHPKVTVSIDTFQWGVVFFRKEQAKQHFVIRV